MNDDEETRKVWNKKFKVLYTIVLREKAIDLEMNVTNNGEDEFDLSFCFHTYLTASDVPKVEISGLKGLTYADKTVDGIPKVEETNDIVKISAFTDRVYADAPNEVVVKNVASSAKTLKMTKNNLADFVVWNPWETAAKLPDMHEDGYKEFVCVEATQASKKAVVTPNGGQWIAKHSISIQ